MSTVRFPRGGRGDFHVRKVPDATRRAFRRVCDRLGVTMQEAIVLLMERVIDKPKTLRKSL